MTTMTTHQIEDITSALREAHRDGLLERARNDVLTGLSGTRLVGALQRLTSLLREDECYCEVGVFQGLTLLSTAYANPSIACFGIDNFSQFDAGGVNESLVRQRAASLCVRNAHLINADFEVALRTADQWLEGRRIGVYFVDGPHDYRSQLVCLLRAKRLLAPGAVIVVDDANYEHVRRANADFLESHDDFALLSEAYTPGHPANMNEAQRKSAMDGWWNGVNVLVHDPGRELPRRSPPTGSTSLYFQSHDVFRAEFAEAAADALRFCGALCDADEMQAGSLALALRTRLTAMRDGNPQRFAWQNTGSAGLPAFSLHAE